MPVYPVRDFSAPGGGIIKDMAPWSIPMTAWSAGKNVRFQDGKAIRSNVYREAVNLTPTLADAAHVTAVTPTAGEDYVFAVDSTGRIVQYLAGGTLQDVSGSDWTAVSGTTQFTSCVLGDLLYVNRETHAPRYFGDSASTFATLPNWNAAWRCNILRAYQDFLVAFAVQENGVYTGQMVKWSDATLAGQVPDTWDATLASGLQGENVLDEMDTDIIDAQTLMGVMLIYGQRQTWLMEFTGNGTYPFTFTKLFGEIGAIGRNCAVEVRGKHYVFGPSDLWVTDGNSWQSIANSRVRAYVFNTMNQSLASRFFVSHDPNTRTVRYHYVSGDADTVFLSPVTGCNRVAAYNYENDTWAFEEEPCVTSEVLSNLNTALSYAAAEANAASTYLATGGTYLDQTDGFKPVLFSVGNVLGTQLTQARLYVMDPCFNGSRVALPQSAEANTLGYIERQGIDLDNAGLPLVNFKCVRNVDPQAYIYQNVPLTFQFGAVEVPQQSPNYTSIQSFNPQTDYRLNTRVAGRYVSIRVSEQSIADFELSGFDLDVVGNGRR